MSVLKMPLTSVFVFLYVLAIVLLAERTATSQLASLIGLMLVLVFALELLNANRSFHFPGPLVWGLVFACFCVFQMIWAPGSVSRFASFVELFLLAVVIVNSCISGDGLEAIEYGLYVAVPLTFVYNVILPQIPVEGRIGSTLVNPNEYSFLLVLALVFALRRLLTDNLRGVLTLKAGVALVAFSAVCVYGAVYLTGSRKGMLIAVFAFAGLSLYWIWQQPLHRRVFVTAAAGVLFVALGYAVYEAPQFARVVELTNLIQGGNVTDTGLVKRNVMLHDAIRLWLQRPYTGWGFDQFRIVSGWATYSHNNYVELLADNGLIGLLIYLMAYVSAFVALSRARMRSMDRGWSADLHWGSMLLSVLVLWDAGAVTYYDKLRWLAISVAIALPVRSLFLARKNAGNPEE